MGNWLTVEPGPEREALDSAMARVREEWGFVPSFDLEDLVAKWTGCVLRIETREGLELLDFEYCLWMRDELDLVLSELPKSLVAKVATVVDPLDTRFVNGTRLTDKALYEPEEGEILHERWFREPLVGR